MQELHKRIDIIVDSTISIDEKLQKICQLLSDEIDYYN